MNFMIHYNGGAVFVKEYGFFQDQKRESPTWDTSAWKGPITADGIEHARLIGENMVREGKLKAPVPKPKPAVETATLSRRIEWLECIHCKTEYGPSDDTCPKCGAFECRRVRLNPR
jgi:hypothetical protein